MFHIIPPPILKWTYFTDFFSPNECKNWCTLYCIYGHYWRMCNPSIFFWNSIFRPKFHTNRTKIVWILIFSSQFWLDINIFGDFDDFLPKNRYFEKRRRRKVKISKCYIFYILKCLISNFWIYHWTYYIFIVIACFAYKVSLLRNNGQI